MLKSEKQNQRLIHRAQRQMEGKNKLPTTRLTPLPLPTQHASLSLSAQKEEQSLGTGLHKRSQSQQYSPGRRQQNPQAIQSAPSESGSTLEANLRAKPGIAPRATVSGGSIASHGQQSLSRSAWRCPAARLDSRRSNVVPPGRGSRAAPAEGGLGPGATRLGTALSPPPPARQHRGDGTPGVCEGRRHVPSPREMESGGGWGGGQRGISGDSTAATRQRPPLPRAHRRRAGEGRRRWEGKALPQRLGQRGANPTVCGDRLWVASAARRRPAPAPALAAPHGDASSGGAVARRAGRGVATTTPRVPRGDAATRRAVAPATALPRRGGRAAVAARAGLARAAQRPPAALPALLRARSRLALRRPLRRGWARGRPAAKVQLAAGRGASYLDFHL